MSSAATREVHEESKFDLVHLLAEILPGRGNDHPHEACVYFAAMGDDDLSQVVRHLPAAHCYQGKTGAVLTAIGPAFERFQLSRRQQP